MIDRPIGGPATPPEIAEAVEGYRHDTDNVARFVDEYCDRSPTAQVRPGELHGVYRRWCEDWSEPPSHEREFKARLLDLGFQRRTVNGYPFWIGLSLRHGDHARHDGSG